MPPFAWNDLHPDLKVRVSQFMDLPTALALREAYDRPMTNDPWWDAVDTRYRAVPWSDILKECVDACDAGLARYSFSINGECWVARLTSTTFGDHKFDAYLHEESFVDLERVQRWVALSFRAHVLGSALSFILPDMPDDLDRKCEKLKRSGLIGDVYVDWHTSSKVSQISMAFYYYAAICLDDNYVVDIGKAEWTGTELDLANVTMNDWFNPAKFWTRWDSVVEDVRRKQPKRYPKHVAEEKRHRERLAMEAKKCEASFFMRHGV